MEAKVFFADLRHNYSGVLSTDCMPLGIGYLKAVMDRDLPEVSSSLFAYPDHLWEEMSADPPDVLMLANYMWCEELSLAFARKIKELKPEALVVMGGPNISLEDSEKAAFMRNNPAVDIYVLGEGDFLATEVVRTYLECDRSLEKFREVEIDSTLYRRNDGAIMVTQAKPRRRELDEIPSPFLTGIMDQLFDGKLAPMIETNRGCPFTCSFCVQGEKWWSKVNYFDKFRIRDEIDYIGNVITHRSPSMGTLRIADSNYGMFNQDVEISGWIGESQKNYGYPTFIDATTGKNKPERIIESMEKVNGALVLYQAVQSLDDDALRNIRRSNIKKEAYDEVMIHVRGRGMRSLSDLILGLPGETLDTHIDGIHYLINSGTHEMHNFQSMMLKGAELDTARSREEHEFTTRFRVLPKNYGIYGGEKVLDFDEIVIATKTLSFDDYIKARTYHFVCSVFWNNSWFDDVLMFAHNLGIKSSDWLDAIYEALREDKGAGGELVGNFLDETRNELFETKEACREFYFKEENWKRLEAGEIGDNLMYKYRAQASFFYWPELCSLALDAMKGLISDKLTSDNTSFEALWKDLCTFVELKHAAGETKGQLLAPVTANLQYDITAWLEEGAPADYERFHVGGFQSAEFFLPENARKELELALETWELSLRGMTKGVTRIRNSAQIRSYRWSEAAAV